MNTGTLERIAVAIGMAALTGIIVIMAALAFYLFAHGTSTAQSAPPIRPYSCRLLDEAERACAFGQCDKRQIDRLRKECLRAGGRP